MDFKTEEQLQQNASSDSYVSVPENKSAGKAIVRKIARKNITKGKDGNLEYFLHSDIEADYSKNPRDRNSLLHRRRITLLKVSLEENGFNPNKPIIGCYDEEKGKVVITEDGFQRYEAIAELISEGKIQNSEFKIAVYLEKNSKKTEAQHLANMQLHNSGSKFSFLEEATWAQRLFALTKDKKLIADKCVPKRNIRYVDNLLSVAEAPESLKDLLREELIKPSPLLAEIQQAADYAECEKNIRAALSYAELNGKRLSASLLETIRTQIAEGSLSQEEISSMEKAADLLKKDKKVEKLEDIIDSGDELSFFVDNEEILEDSKNNSPNKELITSDTGAEKIKIAETALSSVEEIKAKLEKHKDNKKNSSKNRAIKQAKEKQISAVVTATWLEAMQKEGFQLDYEATENAKKIEIIFDSDLPEDEVIEIYDKFVKMTKTMRLKQS